MEQSVFVPDRPSRRADPRRMLRDQPLDAIVATGDDNPTSSVNDLAADKPPRCSVPRMAKVPFQRLKPGLRMYKSLRRETRL